MGGFLAGKLASHAVLGLLLGALGDAVQLGFRTRAVTQGVAGAVMVLLALHLLGVRGLGFPGSVRWAAALGGKVATATAVVVLAVGLYTLNGGLTLGGAPVNAAKLVAALSGPVASTPARAATPQGPVYGPVAQSAAGPQEFEIEVLDTDYRTPGSVPAGRPTVLTLVTDGTRGCTRGFVIPALGIEQILPETGKTQIDLGVLQAGRLEFTCSMGMYGGVLDVVA